MTTFGQTLKELRRGKRMTLCDVAESARISLAYLSSIERGTRTPPDEDIIRRIVNAIGEPRKLSELMQLAKQTKQDSLLRESLKDFPQKKQEAIMLLARSPGNSAIWDQLFKAIKNGE